MKAKELASKLLQYPNFDAQFGIVEPDGPPYGVGLRVFSVDVGDVGDIGYSSEVVRLGPKEEL